MDKVDLRGLDLGSLPLRHQPWEHQERELRDAWDLPARAMLWHMRTGKTKVIVDTAHLLRRYRDLNGVVILAPNGVHANWILNEVPKHSWAGEPYTARLWSSDAYRTDADYRSRLESVVERGDRGLRWLAVNSEALMMERVQKLIKAFLRACGGGGRVMFVADESDDFRRPGARRTRLARGLAHRCAWRRILTGTAVLNSPLHAYAQFELLEKGALGFTRMGDFKSRYAVYKIEKRRDGRLYPVIDRYVNLEELRERMGRLASVVLREDVDDMPDLVMTDSVARVSAAQHAAYRELVGAMLLELEDGRVIDAVEGGVRFAKLQQVLGGFVYDENGDAVSLDDSPPRLDSLWRHVEGNLPGKCVVWCRFREDIRRVSARLRKEMGDSTVVEYHGGVAPAARAEALRRLQEDDGTYSLVGQPQAGGRGLNMSAASLIVNYSHSHNAIVRQQSIERATEKGGGSVGIVDIHVPGTVEDGIMEVLAGRVKMADMLSGRGLRDLLEATDPLR